MKIFYEERKLYLEFMLLHRFCDTARFKTCMTYFTMILNAKKKN